MSPTTPPATASTPQTPMSVLHWLVGALFLSYLCVAMSMPTTAIQVATKLHMGNAMAGLAVGVAFASTILTRGFAGRLADQKGGRHCMVLGLILYALSSLICIGATWIQAAVPGFLVLILGRLVLGLGESLTVVGLLAWSIGLMGHHRSGRVLSVVGMGMYGSLAAGSPLGLAIYDHAGYLGVGLACLVAPLAGLAMVVPVAPVAPHPGERQPLTSVIARIRDLGFIVFLQGIGFAAIGAFMPLIFLHQHWPHASLGLTFFGGAFVLVRVLCGHLPDKIGGARVAVLSMGVETCGQLLLWSATAPGLALVGAALTGAGCSMIFPAMGMEVVRRVSPHMRGTAMGGFAAFQDLAYGATGPLTGLLADRMGENVVFLVGALAACGGFGLSLSLALKEARQTRESP